MPIRRGPAAPSAVLPMGGPGGPAGPTTAAALTDVAAALKAVLLSADLPAARAALGLGNVANLAPADLPVSSATATAIAGLATQVTANAGALSAILGGANPALDTFLEAYNRFLADESAAAAMLAAIGALQTALAAEISRAQGAEGNNATAIANEVSRAQGVEAALASRARQVTGAGLATGGGDLTADRVITVPKAAPSDVAAGTDDAKALTSYSVAARFGLTAPLASPPFTGVPTAPTAAADTSTGQLATTAFVLGQAAAVAPAMDGTAAAGTATRFARADHVHPTDASRVPTGRQVIAGAGMAGGGALAGDVTLGLAAIPTLTLLANAGGASAAPAGTSLSALLDAAVGAGRGTILVRGASGWGALALGANGTTLQSNGTDPVYAAASPGTGALRYDIAQALAAADIARVLASIGLDGAETDVASAATCDIGAVNTEWVRITGTSTITSLGTMAKRVRFLRFAGALTLTHNATSLILPTAANIVTAAGDTAIAVSDTSNNWRVPFYQRAAGTALVPGFQMLGTYGIRLGPVTIQWGSATVGGDVSTPFQQAFSGAAYAVVATPEAGGTADRVIGANADQVTASSFALRARYAANGGSAGTLTIGVRWIAVGPT